MIPVMNVSRQYKGLQEELDQAALKVLHSGNYILGDEEKAFEAEFANYIGTKYAVGVGNGTDALVIALMAAGIGAGDEVITTAMSFFATAEAIAVVGAVPVFVDCTRDTFTLNPDLIEAKITSDTKAIIPVHLYGQCADMDRINEIAKAHHLIVIEDCAQAAGAKYKGRKAGSLADISCISFFPTKNLGGAGDGGMILTDHEKYYKQALAYRVHGSGTNGLYAYGQKNGIDISEEQVDFHGNLPKYYNFVTGFNSRLDTLQAALLRIKLPYLDKWNAIRRETAEQYRKEIVNSCIEKPACSSQNEHIYYVYVVLVPNRGVFRDYLEENGVGSGVYFPIPLHLQKVFENLGYKEGDFPVAEYLAEHGVAIPMFPELTDEEKRKVIDVINNFKMEDAVE